MVALLLMMSLMAAAPVALAGPVDGFGWLGWVESAWSSLLEAVGVTSAESGTEEEPEPVPAPKPSPEPDAPTTDCATCGGDQGPHIDPNG